MNILLLTGIKIVAGLGFYGLLGATLPKIPPKMGRVQKGAVNLLNCLGVQCFDPLAELDWTALS